MSNPYLNDSDDDNDLMTKIPKKVVVANTAQTPDHSLR